MTMTDSDSAQRARFRTLEALARLTARIARATTAEHLFDATLDALAESVGAERAAVLLYDEQDVMRFRAWRGLSDAYRALAEGHSPWSREAKEPRVVFVPDTELDDALEALRPEFRSEGIRALAFIPLVVRGTLIGKFMVYWAESHQLTDVELESVSGIAERVALGLNRLHTEEALRASRDQFESILRGITDGVTVQDRTGRLVFANPAAARLTGMTSVDELLAAPPGRIMERFAIFDEFGDPFDPSDLPGRHALAGETASPVLVRFISRADHAERWSLVSASPVFDSQGQVQLAINIFRDVTQAQEGARRERFLAAMGGVLASSSLDYHKTLESLARVAVPALADWCRIDLAGPDGTARTVAVEHRDPSVLARAREMIQRHHPRPDTSAVLRVIANGKPELHAEITDQMLEQPGLDPELAAFLREIGLRSAMVVPLVARGRTLAALTLVAASPGRRFSEADLAFAEDVARRAALVLDNALLFRDEQEARRREETARSEAEAANRAKDEFLATLSHELRTPLTAIVGWSRMLTTMPADAELRDEGLRAIARSAEAQTRIVEDLLDVSRIITGKLHLATRVVRLREVIEAAVAAVRPAAEARRLVIEWAGAADAAIQGDADRLQQVFWNLLANAVKFTTPGGRVEIRISAVEREVAVSVADSGRGIPKELLPFIFERFRQGDAGSTRSHGGLGLGLAIVKSLVELHGGTVLADSAGEGKGATFTVRFPLSEPAAEDARVAGGKGRTLAGRRVLLVEDDAEARGFLATLLERVGADVRAAAGVGAALALLDGWSADVIVSDLAMPGQDGFDLIRLVRSEPSTRSVRAVALSAYGRDEDRDRALQAGFDSFLRKPIDPASFLDMVAGG